MAHGIKDWFINLFISYFDKRKWHTSRTSTERECLTEEQWIGKKTKALKQLYHKNGWIIRMTALLFTADVQVCLQPLQWITDYIEMGYSYFHYIPILTQWGRDKVDAISQTTFSNAFSWMKMHEFRLRFHWSLILRFELTIYQHWFR